VQRAADGGSSPAPASAPEPAPTAATQPATPPQRLDPRRALRLCLPLFVGFNALYSGLLFYVFPRLL